MSRSPRKVDQKKYSKTRYAHADNFQSEDVIDLNRYRRKNKKVEILPRSVNQESLLLALEDPKSPIVTVSGPAGSGKTLISTLYAIKSLQNKRYEKVVIARPNIAVDDKDIGFLPGDIFKKMAPWMMPILDIFKEYYAVQEVEDMIRNEVIEIAPIAFLRGRTFKRAVVIVDEAQGLTFNSMKTVLTRIGEDSKMIITGDVRQTDRPGDNGLLDLIERLSENETQYIKLVTFDNKDIERHPAVKEVLKIYKE